MTASREQTAASQALIAAAQMLAPHEAEMQAFYDDELAWNAADHQRFNAYRGALLLLDAMADQLEKVES